MTAHHHAPQTLSDLPLGWPGQPGHGGLLALLEHARRRAALRRRQVLPEGRLRYLLNSLVALPRHAAWLKLVGSSRTMRAAAELNPRLYERWQPHYISRDFDLAARARMVDAHYRFISKELPERLSRRLLKGHDVRLATLPLGGGEMAYLHARAPENESCGELGLVLLNGDKEVIASCAITFAGEEGVLLGALRGPWACLDRSAMLPLIRASGGLRPRDLLFAVVRALARHYGFRRLRGVSAEAHPLGRRAGVTMAAYDRFWRRHGGIAGDHGCYELPLVSVANDESGERETFRHEVCEVTLRAFTRATGTAA
ncbi:VirK/YbjX family protein [Luteibacter anthropi]|uniref:DUF535 family protein n=1 Tax=Luteibacter anthropi TaxID=564369 RepID=UPI002032A9E2|nr:DUF535 family protein [Luteibacter anthropi]URX63921.1 VirK/YbjX family protein [Luteibacter anthropi]